MSSTVFVRDRREAEIELRETLRVEESIDLDDLPVRDGEGHHRQHAAARRHDGPGGVGVEHLQEGIEVAVARGGEERIDDASLPREVTVRLRRVGGWKVACAGRNRCPFPALETVPGGRRT
jgi:hypothetical protein